MHAFGHQRNDDLLDTLQFHQASIERAANEIARRIIQDRFGHGSIDRHRYREKWMERLPVTPPIGLETDRHSIREGAVG